MMTYRQHFYVVCDEYAFLVSDRWEAERIAARESVGICGLTHRVGTLETPADVTPPLRAYAGSAAYDGIVECLVEHYDA